MDLLSKLKKNIYMNHNELVDQVSSSLIREGGKLESLKSWLVMRDYLQQLSDDQLKEILQDVA